MLKILLSISRDVVISQIVPFLDLISLTKLDTATMSHEHRSDALVHIFTDVTMSGDEVCTYCKEMINWLSCRKVCISKIRFPRNITDVDLAFSAPAIANAKYIDLTGCNDVTNGGVQAF